MSSSSQNIGCHITLGEIATYINGYAFKPSDYSSKEGNPIIRIQDLTGNSYETNKFSGSLPEKYRVNNGDILISWSASLGVYEWTKGPAWLNQHIFKVVFDKKPINKSFFIHQARHIIDNSENLAHGATMRHLTKKVFDALPFYYPDPQEQQQIAAHLDDLSATIDLCKTANRKLENLVKSRFIEMFDSEKFELVKLGDYCERVTKGATPTTLGYRYQDNGINFIKVESLAEDGSIIADKVAHISDECNDAMRRSQLRTGDIVFSIAGAIGRTAIIPDSVLPANTNQALAIIRLRNPLAFDRIFLRYALISSDVTRSISSSKRGIAQVNLSLTDIKNLRVPLPPLALQQEFANFVSQVDKLRFATQQQIDKLETLKKSLMQEYFE